MELSRAMKSLFALLLSALMLLSIGGCSAEPAKPTASITAITTSSPPNTYIPSIVVNDIVYSTTGRQLAIDADESDYLGCIKSVVSLTAMPTENGQANTSTVGAPYMAYEDGLALMIDGQWYLFEVRGDLPKKP